jgi:hypothetical protein
VIWVVLILIAGASNGLVIQSLLDSAIQVAKDILADDKPFGILFGTSDHWHL